MGSGNAAVQVAPLNDMTVVVVPRERFSHALASLDSIERHTDGPFDPIVVDGHFQHRHVCATGSWTMPAMAVLFGDYGSTLGRREKCDQLLGRLSPGSGRGR